MANEQVVDKLIIDIEVKGADTSKTKINSLQNEVKNTKNETNEFKEKVEETDKKLKKATAGGFATMAAKVGIIAYALKRSWSALGGFVASSNQYVENLNLFRVTFGNLADEAERFATNYSTALGLDPSEVMRNMGFFNQIASGFGLANDKAFEMSQTLTQVAYDLSSFLNIDVADAVQKVQSGLAGELEPLRRVGYALDEATLQQLAYENGINKSIRAMTQAEKAQLRTLAIYKQSGNVMGDLAGTIMSPANQLRIMAQQITLLKRSIGNTLIPVLMQVLPYFVAFIKVLEQAFTSMAKFMGFEVTGARESAIESVFDGITTSAEEAEKAMSNSLLSFDKFSVLGGQDKKETGGLLDLEIPTYNALTGLSDIANKTKEIADNIGRWLFKFDDEGNVKSLSNDLNAIIATLLTLQAIKIKAWFATFITGLKGATLGTKLLTVASQLLLTAGIFLIIYSIMQLVTSWDELTTGMKLAYGALIIFGTGLAILSTVGKAKAISALMAISSQVSILTLGFSALGIAIGFGLFKLMEGLDSKTKQWVGGFLALAGAITAVAIAVLALQGTITMGIAIPIIVGAVSAGVAGLMTAINGAKEIKGFATGGFTPETSGSLFMAGENGRQELMGTVGGRNAVANVDSIEKAMERASYRGMLRAIADGGQTQGGKDIVINIDGKEMARTQVKNTASALSNSFRVEFQPR